MAELILTDLEFQKLVGTALRARLKKDGFEFNRSMDARCSEFDFYQFPITLDLGGTVSIEHTSDGWVFRQTADVITERLHDSFVAHSEAMARREQPTN